MRARDVSYIINSRMKDKVIKSNEITKETPKDETKNKLNEDTKSRFRQEDYDNYLNLITFPVPEYKDISKVFPSKNVKPIKIHQNGFLAKIDPKSYEYLPNNKQPIDFSKMASLYDNQEQLDQVDSEQLLGISLEKYGELNEKLDKFINVSQSSDFKNSQIQGEVINYLQQKKTEIDEDEDKYKNIVCHIENIKTITYGDKTDVTF
ncbi:MAG: hypothetical protein MJ252_20430 [archaeon]|nr:hypothetical protein [archaeon]